MPYPRKSCWPQIYASYHTFALRFLLFTWSPFRAHEFNVEILLSAFLPFHETPQFSRMLQICKLEWVWGATRMKTHLKQEAKGIEPIHRWQRASRRSNASRTQPRSYEDLLSWKVKERFSSCFLLTSLPSSSPLSLPPPQFPRPIFFPPTTSKILPSLNFLSSPFLSFIHLNFLLFSRSSQLNNQTSHQISTFRNSNHFLVLHFDSIPSLIFR